MQIFLMKATFIGQGHFFQIWEPKAAIKDKNNLD